MSTSSQTHNHQTIKEWAEERGGVPARVAGTGTDNDEGVLRIHFPEFSKSDDLEEISWDDFFEDFEKEELDFLYQEEKSNGEQSTFHKLVARAGYALVFLIGLGLAGCGSDNRNNETNDSMLTDTAIMDTSSVDSIATVDSAVQSNTTVDSPGVGNSPAPQPR